VFGLEVVEWINLILWQNIAKGNVLNGI